MYDELMRAEVTARGLQTEYFHEMSRHISPLPVAELVYSMRPETISVSLHFRQIFPEYSRWDKLLIWLKWRKPLPDGTYLLLSNEQEASLHIAVGVSADSVGQLRAEPELSEKENYYVATKTG